MKTVALDNVDKTSQFPSEKSLFDKISMYCASRQMFSRCIKL